MDIQATFTALANKLQTVNPAPQPAPVRVFANPAEAVSLADFPCIVLKLADGQRSKWATPANGLGRNDYVVSALVFVGARTTGIAELYSRVLPWPKAIADVLLSDITLGGQVEFLGNYDGGFFQWSARLIKWGDGVYYGLEFLIPVCEQYVQQVS